MREEVEKAQGGKRGKKIGHELVIIEVANEYGEFMILFSPLWHVFEIFSNKRLKREKSNIFPQ